MKRTYAESLRLCLLCCVALGMHAHTAYAQNLVPNPGFEDNAASWNGVQEGHFARDNTVSHSGASSMKFTSTTPLTAVESVWYKFNAEPGHRYRIGAWVKVKGFPADKGGVAVDLVWFDKTTRAQIARKTSQYLVGSNYDWVHVYCETASSMPANVGEAWLLLQVRPGSTGMAWFDDASVEALDDTVFEAVYKYPNYRHTILPGMPRNLCLVYDYSPGVALRGVSTVIKTEVRDSKNKVVASGSVIPGKAGAEEPQVSIDVSGLAPGAYTVSSDLVKKASGKVVISVTLPLAVAKPTDRLAKVYFDSQNRCIVDGKPFFPRGLYTNLYADYMKTDLSKFASAGFNTTLNYSWTGMSLSSMRKILDNHHAAGMKAIASVHSTYDNLSSQRKSLDGITGNDHITRHVVNGIKDKPALLVYYINEELIDWMVPQIQRKYDLISELDPEHPVYQVLGNFAESLPRMHFPNCDVIGYDDYPLKEMTRSSKTTAVADFDQAHIDDFYSGANRLYKAGHNSVPNWMVVPCSTVEPGDENERPPTYNEIMFFSYQAMVNGARGLIFWYYSFIRDHDGEPQWEVMKRVGSHLTAIEPLVLADDADARHCAVSSDQRVKLITRSHNGKLYIMAVNSSIEAVTSRFTLPMPILRTVSHGLPGSFANKLKSDATSFSDRLDPLQTRVYELSIGEA